MAAGGLLTPFVLSERAKPNLSWQHPQRAEAFQLLTDRHCISSCPGPLMTLGNLSTCPHHRHVPSCLQLFCFTATGFTSTNSTNPFPDGFKNATSTTELKPSFRGVHIIRASYPWGDQKCSQPDFSDLCLSLCPGRGTCRFPSGTERWRGVTTYQVRSLTRAHAGFASASRKRHAEHRPV